MNVFFISCEYQKLNQQELMFDKIFLIKRNEGFLSAKLNCNKNPQESDCLNLKKLMLIEKEYTQVILKKDLDLEPFINRTYIRLQSYSYNESPASDL